ncbi:platelet glycoprotein 4 [Gadus morhua]|uniref:platelet glycoprotein 4 n=1 Tax=Gadus morhua TaxID=8049 RepID=UPI0011B46C40|nr:platelet glycoprotein 4 [Gadus morhua]
MGCCNRRCGLLAGAVFGAALAILGGILIPVGDQIIQSTVEKEAVIVPGTTAYENWISSAAFVYRQMWLFDVQNALDVVELGATPIVKERGPYTYKVRYLAKSNITAHNDAVSFLLPNGAIFEPDMSVGSEDDLVTTLNLAVAGAYSLVPKNLHFFLDHIIKSTKSSLFQRRSVREILWGYQDPILKDILGVFYPYNGTFDGYYTVNTGQDDISRVAMIERWQGESKLSFWNDTYCDTLNGTDASSFPPFVDKNKPIYFFSSDICRSVSSTFRETQDLWGIEVYRYVLPPSTFASPSINPDNKCFCTEKLVSRNCSMAGVLDVGPCRGGAPVYISLPHFLHGSDYLRQDVLGLNPSEENHFTYLDIEPITGFTLSFAKRLQVNMMYGPSKVISVLKHVKEYTVFPIVWLNETATLDEATADRIKAELFSRINLLENVQMSLIGIGAATFALCLVSYCCVRC